MIVIKEDEKIKVLSEITTGCFVASILIDITNPKLIPFNSLVGGLKFYNQINKKLITQKDITFFIDSINKYNIIINKFKKINSYFIFDISNSTKKE